MNATLVIYSAPITSRAPYQALAFARAWLATGHTIERVFFYADGVFTGAASSAPPRDEFDAHREWQQMALAHNLDLVLCISAALRRGVIDTHEATRFQRPVHNLGDGFRLGGLGELVEATLRSDRTVSFGRHN
ncbi:MAG TPA: sulfurtransferase complex subunit TusD [Pseudomonadales bacterium]|nr:sulfurtransferase complex subunit TusD [Pseudomonadales bacterium]